MVKKKIKLGSVVKCKYTDFTGVAVARVEFINGCVQYEVQPKVDDKGSYVESTGIDVDSLEVVRTPKKKVVSKPTGGPNTKITRRNY